jgi:beta-glucanase (GH16 family)
MSIKSVKMALLLMVAMLMIWVPASHADWQLVWNDEFDGSIGPDWVFETGMGDGGWGNNELQYYRAENASVENGALKIQARQESYGGASYTSARMKTQGNASWKYGKIEARIAMPRFMGVWPAFWMLGDSIASEGWPACGEIDIMEHINDEYMVYGAAHWDDNGQADYGGSTSATVNDYHVYSIEWDDQYIKWFLDGSQYHEIYIGGGINGTEEFHEPAFIILNMAIGGNWPGFTIDDSAFPADMYVDYVRVYQKTADTSE